MVGHHRQSRRTAIRTIGTVGVAALGLAGTAGARVGSNDDEDDEGGDDCDGPGGPDGATRYVAVVDRIVDGEHVVLLLEKDDELVDQLVVSVGEFERIEAGDTLLVVARDGELLAHRHVPERPPGGV